MLLPVAPQSVAVVCNAKPTKPRLQPATMKLVTSVISGDASSSGVCVADGAASMKGVVAGTDTQRMLFHAPDGASGTVVRSFAAGVDVGVAAGEAVAGADGDADAVPVGLASGKSEAEPLAVAPTQPAAAKAAIATSALNLHQPRRLADVDSTACPFSRSSLPERVCDAILEGGVIGSAIRRPIRSLTRSRVAPRGSNRGSSR